MALNPSLDAGACAWTMLFTSSDGAGGEDRMVQSADAWVFMWSATYIHLRRSKEGGPSSAGLRSELNRCLHESWVGDGSRK